MNISLLIYFADIANNVTYFLVILSLLIVSFLICAIQVWVDGWKDKIVRRSCYSLIFTAILFGSIAQLIPSKQAIYLMAGVEVGKELIQSETAKKVKILVDKKLDELLKEGNKK